MASESEAINIMEGIRIQMSRNKTIDVAKAIGIILVIMEYLVVYLGRAFTLISAFSMPLFFFLSGYCFDSQKYNNIGQFLTKKMKSIMVPYLGFLTLGLGKGLHNLFGINNNNSTVNQRKSHGLLTL